MNIKILKHSAKSYKINNYDVVAIFDSNANLGVPFYDDERIEKLENFDDTFKFSIPAESELVAEVQVGRYVTFKDETDKYRLFRIYEINDVTIGSAHMKEVLSESSIIDDMYYSIVPRAKLGNANFPTAMAHLLARTGWELGNVDFMGQTNKLEFDGTTNALESLREILSTYRGEIDAYAVVQSDQIVGKKVDLVQRRGRNNTGRRFRYGRDIEGIRRTQSNEEFFTAILPIGKDGLTVSTVNNKNDTIYDDEANFIYNAGKEHRVKRVEFSEVENPATLLALAKAELARNNKPKFQYEIDVALLEDTTGYEDLGDIQQGDYVTIVDFDMIPEMTVLARVNEKITSYTGLGRNKIVMGDFIELANVKPNEIKQLQSQLTTLNDKLKPDYRVDIYSTGKTIIKNGVGTTDLIARVYKDGKQIYGQPHQYLWKKRYPDGSYDTAWEAANLNIGDTVYGVPSKDFVDEATYECYFLDETYQIVAVDYFKQELDRVIGEIAKVRQANSIVIPFITDTHVATDADVQENPEAKERALTHHLYNVVELTYQIPVDCVVHGGDIVDGKTNNYTNQANLHAAVNTLNECDAPVMFCKGNHDDNQLGDNRKYGGVGNETTKPKELSPIIKGDYATKGIKYNMNDYAIYSYYDVPDKNVRLICVDMWDLRYDLLKVNSKGVKSMKYPSNKFGGVQSKQIQWLIQTLKDTPKDCGVVLFSHTAFKDVFEEEDDVINHEIITAIVNSWQDGARFTNTGINSDYPVTVDADFRARGKGKLISSHVGHKHKDSGIRKGLGDAPTILTTSSLPSGDKNNFDRAMYTANETAFDVIVINPDENYKIHMVRFGANGKTRPVRSYESGVK